MGLRYMLVAAVATAAVPGAAWAQDPVAWSRNAILHGDFAGAERTLSAERRIYPERADVLLNLAAVYSRTGRGQEASALYRVVLDRRDVLLDVDADRTASAHQIARAALLRTSMVQTAAR